MLLFFYFKYNKVVTVNNYLYEFSYFYIQKKIEFYILDYSKECIYVIYKYTCVWDIYIIDQKRGKLYYGRNIYFFKINNW